MARLHRELMDVLTEEIVNGEHPPGSMLPREADLVELFGVSRSTVREGIRALEERGLVAVRHGKGATVNPPTDWNTLDPDVLRPLLASPFSIDALRSYLECRRILEVEAAALSAERATDADVARIADALETMESLAARPGTSAVETRFHEADVAFHRAVVAGTRNSALASLTETIQAAVVTARFFLAAPDYRLGRAVPEHHAIHAAIAARDAGAARAAMGAHLRTVEEIVLRAAAGEDDGESAAPGDATAGAPLRPARRRSSAARRRS